MKKSNLIFLLIAFISCDQTSNSIEEHKIDITYSLDSVFYRPKTPKNCFDCNIYVALFGSIKNDGGSIEKIKLKNSKQPSRLLYLLYNGDTLDLRFDSPDSIVLNTKTSFFIEAIYSANYYPMPDSMKYLNLSRKIVKDGEVIINTIDSSIRFKKSPSFKEVVR